MFWILILMLSMTMKLNILSILFNMEIILVWIFMNLFNLYNKIFLINFMVFMVSEAVIGLTLCIKFSFSFNNLKIEKLNLVK